LTFTFVLGRATGFASGLGLIAGIETGNKAFTATGVAVFATGFATTFTVCFLTTGFTAFFADCFRTTAFRTFFAFIFFGFLSSFFLEFAFDFFFVAIVLTHFLQNCLMESFPHTLKRDALHDRIEVVDVDVVVVEVVDVGVVAVATG